MFLTYTHTHTLASEQTHPLRFSLPQYWVYSECRVRQLEKSERERERERERESGWKKKKWNLNVCLCANVRVLVHECFLSLSCNEKWTGRVRLPHLHSGTPTFNRLFVCIICLMRRTCCFSTSFTPFFFSISLSLSLSPVNLNSIFLFLSSSSIFSPPSVRVCLKSFDFIGRGFWRIWNHCMCRGEGQGPMDRLKTKRKRRERKMQNERYREMQNEDGRF